MALFLTFKISISSEFGKLLIWLAVRFYNVDSFTVFEIHNHSIVAIACRVSKLLILKTYFQVTCYFLNVY